METSSLYLRCPGCETTTLLLREGSRVVCASCRFDYRAFAADVPAFEAYLVERLRGGLGDTLGAIALHQWLSDRGPAESSRAIRELASKHGVALPAPTDGDPVLRAGLAVVALVAIGVVSLFAWFVFAAK